MKWFLKRLAEPSTHASLASLIGAIALGVTTKDVGTAASIAIPAALGIVIPEARNG